MSTLPPPPPSQPAYTGGWAPPVPRNGQGTAALIIGGAALVASGSVILFFVGGPLGIVGLVLGILALGRVRRGEATNRGVAVTAIVLNSLAVLISGVLLIVAVAGVALFRDVAEDASESVTVQPTTDAAAEGWSQLAHTPGSDEPADSAMAVAAWALPSIDRDTWSKQRIVTVAGNLAAAVQGGADPQAAVDDLAAQEGMGRGTATAFAVAAVETYCTDTVSDAFARALT